MEAPFIGITTYGRDEQGNYPLPAEYVEAVRRAGGVPVLLPPGETRIDLLLKRIDALLLAGGGDIDPAVYGKVAHKTVYMTDPQRDAMEIDLACKVIAKQMPTLAICRGMQIVNVALGGTLHVHLPDIVGDKVTHRAPPRAPISHPISVASNSHLAEILQEKKCVPMSWHHQAVNKLGQGMQSVASAEDGIIEAIESSDYPWLVCVQWHPELTAAKDPSQQRLFDDLVNRAAAQNN